MKNILAEAEVTEKFDSEFAIYDLPEFLRAVELFEKPALKFNGGSNVTIASANNKQAIKYFFADKSVIVAPTKAINMPDQYVSFTLKKDDFARLQRAITTLNLPDVAVVGDGKNIKLVATDKKNKSSNDYSEIIGETDKKFNAYFKAENLKVIGDDYDVEHSDAYFDYTRNDDNAENPLTEPRFDLEYELVQYKSAYSTSEIQKVSGFYLDDIYEAKAHKWMLKNIDPNQKTLFWCVGRRLTSDEVESICKR